MADSKPTVVVVGAGVTGLTSALLLLREGYDVTVIARSIPGDWGDPYYASPYAGAQWMSFAGLLETRQQDWDKPGYYEFLRLAKEAPGAGVHEVPINYYVNKADAATYEYPWFRYLVKDFQKLEDIAGFQYPAPDFTKGFTCSTVTITTTHYLPFLAQQILALGGAIKRAHISHINDATKFHSSTQSPDLVVNATGLLARTLGGVNDKNVYPVKGQIVVLRNSLSRQHVIENLPDKELENEVFYIFPRKEGGCIVGGLYQPVDRVDNKVDPKLTERILKRAKQYIPELTDSSKFPGNTPELDVVTEYVAFRPARKGGIRLERLGNIIHNYGAGGAGYQSSYGTAAQVVKLANSYMAKKKGTKL